MEKRWIKYCSTIILYTFHRKNQTHFISGTPLPTPLSFSTVVPLSESFLLVGGFIDDQPFPVPENTNTIYKYEDDSWTELETKIPYYVQFPVAMMVDIDIFPPCPGEVGSSACSIWGIETVSLTCLVLMHAFVKHL